MKKIPKIIHQIWFQGIENLNKEPYLSCFKSILYGIKGTDWKHMIWDQNSIEELIKNNYPQYWNLYNRYEYMILKIDLARYIILYHYGGVYIDMDMEYIKDFYDLIEENDTLIVNKTYQGFVNNGVILSSQYNNFWIYYINILNKKSPKSIFEPKLFYVERATGPFEFNKMIKNYSKNNYVKILDYEYFEPCYTKYKCNLTHNSRLKNYFGNSWLGPIEKFGILIYSYKIESVIVLIIIIVLYKILRN
jgi:mannosyltransferase OCH1-like enzyme